MQSLARVQHAVDDSMPRPHVVHVAGVPLVADCTGALLQSDENCLIVADLHLEKGSSFATRGRFLPPYDTAATLARLALLVARHNPRMVVCLGDSFHDPRADTRLGAADCAQLLALQSGRSWIWIAGNHDPAPPRALRGEAMETLALGPLTLRHTPLPGAQPGEIAGHLHPVARVTGPSGSTRRRCFVSDGTRCILPAFGSFAGGLNWRDAAFTGLFGRVPVTAHVLGRDRIYAVGAGRCVPD